MSFADDFAQAARGALQTVFGVTVTYTPLTTGVGASITAIKHERSLGGGFTDTPDRRATRYTLSEVDVASPRLNDKITDADGGEWFVDEIGDPVGGMVSVNVSKAQENSHNG